VPATAGRLAVVFVPSPALYLTGSILWLLLFVFITWNQLRGVLRKKQVTSETISMSISVYLLLGFTWALFYVLLHHVQPNAFSFGASPASISGPSSEQLTFPVLIYFGLTTLSTNGFGDIAPVTLQAPYAAAAEGITGQFYLASVASRK
jgi:ion channel